MKAATTDDRHRTFVELLVRNQAAIRAFICSLVRDHHAAEDVFQDVAVVLLETFERYDTSRSFAAWARGVAAKVVMKRWDKQKRTPAPFSPEAVEAILAASEEVDARIGPEREALRRCVAALPARSRKLLALRYESAFRLAQIAEAMESTLSAIHKALTRIRAGLEECIRGKLAAGQEGGA